MATAVVDGVNDAQPCRIIGAGTPRRTLGRVPDVADRLLSPEQVNAVAEAMPARYRALVLAAAWSGLRQGELLALIRADRDLDAVLATVRVRRGVRRADIGVMEVDLPKTRASVRSVSLPAPFSVALASHLHEFVGEEPDALVFTTVSGTNPARSALTVTFRRALDAAGVPPVRFHDLRHVAQVYAAEAGATLPELMARLGHASPGATIFTTGGGGLRSRVRRADNAKTEGDLAKTRASVHTVSFPTLLAASRGMTSKRAGRS